MSTGNFQFIITGGPKVPDDDDTKALIRRKASILGATGRRNARAGREPQSGLLYQDVPYRRKTPAHEGEKDLTTALTKSGAAIKRRLHKTRLANRSILPKLPSVIFTSTYESARSKYGACITELSFLTQWNLGQMTVEALAADSARLTAVLDSTQWSYLQYIPQYYGTNVCLTAAADCLMQRLHRILAGDRGTKWSAAESHMHLLALQTLQTALEDPIQCLTSEILCASLILCLYELLEPTTTLSWTHHVNGSARIIQHRGAHRFKDDFDKALFAANVAPVIANAVVRRQHTYFEEPAWQELWRGLAHDTGKLTIRSAITLRTRGLMMLLPGLFHDAVDAISSPTFATDDNIGLLLRCDFAHQEALDCLDIYAKQPTRRQNRAELSIRRENIGQALSCAIIYKRILETLSFSTEEQQKLERDAQKLARILFEYHQMPPTQYSWLGTAYEFGISMSVIATGPAWLEDTALTGQERRLTLRARYDTWKDLMTVVKVKEGNRTNDYEGTRDPRTGSRWILGNKFDQVYPHLGSIDNLWYKKWKFPCERSLYPFHDGKYEDFAPIFETLIRKGIHDGYTDDYTKEFLAKGEELVKEGDAAGNDRDKAIELYLRACAVYRIARFPYINSDLKREVYDAQKKAYLKASALFEVPIIDISIPHTAGTEQDEGKEIPLYIRVPKNATKSNPCPAVLLMCGLDGHRPDNTVRSNEFLARGWASVIVDIPGTADCPAARNDCSSPDRLWTSILDWMAAQGHYDMKKVLCWGLSAGGHNAIRAAHTHAKRFAGAVGQGAGTHHFFSRAWLEKAKDHEYPWTLLPAMREKLGYKTEEDLLNNAQKDFSLVENKIVDMPSCRLLLINGTHDGLMPIEDSMLMMEYGTPKEARFFTNLLHMGYPPANGSVYPWMESIVGTVPSEAVNGLKI